MAFTESLDGFFFDFSTTATFTVGVWSATVRAILDVSESGGDLAGQSTALQGQTLLIRQQDYDSRMENATAVVNSVSHRVWSVDPDPVDGLRHLRLRRGGL